LDGEIDMARTLDNNQVQEKAPHRFPWWLAFVLTCPLRRLIEDPDETLRGLVKPGQRVLEIGPGNGFYSQIIAATVGVQGRLIAVDAQPQMLKMLSRRLQRLGLSDRLETRLARSPGLGLDDLGNTMDLAVLINVLHEIADQRDVLREGFAALRPGGRLLLVEPRGHVSQSQYLAELALLQEIGFSVEHQTEQSRGYSAVFLKP
jgi:ubiquinone/menaquinone biosynthesis C-methylase UbiE